MKRVPPVVAVGVVLTLGCLALFIAEPPFIRAISSYAYDALLKAVHDDPQSDRVAIVDLDDGSLGKYGQWPWPRYLVARLTDRILEEGAAVVAFDIVFAEEDRTSPRLIEKDINEYLGRNIKLSGIPEDLVDFDQVFAESLAKGKTILGCAMHPSDEPAPDADTSIDPSYVSRLFTRSIRGKGGNVGEFLMQASGITVGHTNLTKSASTAFFNAKVDHDGIVRSNPLIWAFGPNRIYPAMALEAIRMYWNEPQIRVGYDDQGIVNIGLRDLNIPTDKAGRLVVNYRSVRENAKTGFMTSFPTYSATNVLERTLPAGALDGKIVFVGTSAVGLKDVKASPLAEHLSGVEVHATMVDNMLHGDMLSLPYWMAGVHVVVIVIMGAFLTAFIYHGRSWLSFLASMIVIYVSIQVSLYMLDKYHVVFVPVWTVLSVIIIYPVLTMIKFWEEELQKKKVRNMFGTMVSEDVLRYLENNPGSFSLTGQRAEATMLFSDVAGFTTISESLPPDRLLELLNRYLSPMTHIIMERNGYVDKYEGDAIMAEWGVPFAMEDHATQACLAAIEQMDRLDELREPLFKEFGHRLYVRIGVNTGTVTAGNMGSNKKFQYTVMGDAVNQAARFEPANKDYSTRIIIGETTRRGAGDAVETRLLDKIVVKGKTRPIQIYELICRAGEMDASKAEVVKHYVEALMLHWERKWDEATVLLDKALAIDAEDGPCGLLKRRVQWYMAHPPHDEWQGEYVRETKD